MELNLEKLQKILQMAVEKLQSPKIAVAAVGELTRYEKAFAVDLEERTAKYKESIKRETAVNAAVTKRLKERLNAARVALNVAVDNGTAEASTPDWRLVVVHQKRPVLEKFDDLPDEFLLPTEQWVDWKRIDEAVKAGTAVPGISLADVTTARVIPNEAVRV